MDKNEYKVRLEEIRNQIDQENYAEAAQIADMIDWKKVRNVNTLCMISEVYESVDRYEDSKTLLLRAYRRSPMSRTVLYRLVEVTTTLKQFDEAIGYYTEYVQAAPHDTNRYILKYKIYRGRGSSVNEQIEILKEYLDQEYNEQYAYELALLYKEADRMQECIAACDDLVLWFHSGKYVIKALELKRRYAALTPKQQEIYDARFALEDMDRELEIGKEKQMVDTGETTLADSIMEDTERAIAEMVSKAAKEETAEQTADTAAEAAEQTADTVEAAAENAAEAAAAVEETAETAAEEVTAAVEETAETAAEEVTAAAEETAETAAEEVAAVAEETAETAAEEIAAVAEETAETAAEEVAAVAEETAETAAEEAAAAIEETAEAAAEEVAAAVEETAEPAVEEVAAAVEETAESAAEEAAAAVEEAAEVPAPESLLPPQPKSREELQTDIAKDMREIIGNVGRMEYIDENEQALDDLIEESKKDQVREREKDRLRMPSLRMPDLQRKQAAGKLTIDDILLSMGERGDAVREAVAKNSPYNNAAPGVLSAVDEALLNMGITPAGQEDRTDYPEGLSETAKKDRSSEMKEIILPEEDTEEIRTEAAGNEEQAEETTGSPENEEAAVSPEQEADQAGTEDVSSAEESSPDSGDVREAQIKHGTLSNEDLEEALFGKEKEKEESFRDKSMEEIITAKTRRLPTEEIARRYGSIPVDGSPEPAEGEMEEPENVTEESVPEETEQEAAAEAVPGEDAAQTQKEEQAAEEKPDQQEKTAAQEQKRPPIHTGPQLKEDLRELFDGFLDVRGLEGQIVYAIRQALAKGNDRTSRTGNILIFGAHGAGKTTLAMALAKAIAQERGQGYVKMARIYSTDLNRKDIAATVAKIAGGVLIVEEAGDLDDGIADQLTTAMEFRTDGLIVILEDERMYIHELLMRHPRLTMKFTSEIYLPTYTPEELAGFGEVYADEKDFAVSEASREVLISKITAMTENEDPRQPLSITAVKEIMDRAMIRASGFGRKLFGGKKRYDSEGRIILKEKDFS